MFSIFSSTAYAQTAEKAQSSMDFIDMALMIFGFMAIYFFFMTRGQSKTSEERTKFFETLKNGDEIVTTSGIIGRVKSVAEDFITLEIAHNTSVKILKTHITGPSKPQAAKAEVKK